MPNYLKEISLEIASLDNLLLLSPKEISLEISRLEIESKKIEDTPSNWLNGAILPDGSLASSKNPEVFRIINASFDEFSSSITPREREKMNQCTTETQFKKNPESAKEFSP